MASTKSRDPSGAGLGPSQGGGVKGSSSTGKASTGGTKARDPSGAGPAATQGGGVKGGYSTSSKATDGSGLATSPLGGGTTTSWNYSPGAVQNFPDANAAAVADQLSSAIPGVGAANSVYKGGKMLAGEDSTFGPLGDMLGADAGPQKGWQPDRTRGEPANPNDPRGASPDEREIPGRSFGAGTLALTGDDAGGDVTPGPGGDYSDDVMLKDRRRPRVGAGTQMLLGA